MKNKKLTIGITTIAILLIVATAAILSYKFLGNKASQNGNVIATYKGGVITLQQAQTELGKIVLKNPALKGLTFESLNAQQKEMVVKEIILKEIAYKEAKNRGLHKSEDYKKALKLFETEMLKQQLFIKLATDAQEEEKLRENYDKLVTELQGKKDIRISYISLKTENEAKSLHRSLLKYPNSFAKQAKRNSIDKQTAQKGGDLGFVLEDVLPQEVIEHVSDLEKGEISQPFKLADKWMIIKLVDERPAVAANFEDVKEFFLQQWPNFVLKSPTENVARFASNIIRAFIVS